MQYANDKLHGKLVVILNADIYLGRGVDQLIQRRCCLLEPSRSSGPATVLSLTRHEHGICNRKTEGAACVQRVATCSAEQEWCGCPFMKGGKYFGSHDSFWFVAPLKEMLVQECKHVQNRWGAEHKVINELVRAGYHVANPSLTVYTYHHHASDIHPWRHEPGEHDVLADPRDHEPLPPTKLEELMPPCRC
jgi:hypothetical protein